MDCEYIKTFVKQKMNITVYFLQILTETFVKFLSVEFACNLVAFFLNVTLKITLNWGKKCNTGERREAIAYLLDRSVSTLGVDCS